MKKSDFYYNLPEELIAQTPVTPRDHSRLMVVDRESGAITHRHFYNLCDILQKGDLLVMNDSRVLPARLYGEKVDNGTFIEFLLLEQKGDKLWEIICRPGKKAKVGTKFSFGGGKLLAEVVEVKPDGNRIVQFSCDGNFYTDKCRCRRTSRRNWKIKNATRPFILGNWVQQPLQLLACILPKRCCKRCEKRA